MGIIGWLFVIVIVVGIIFLVCFIIKRKIRQNLWNNAKLTIDTVPAKSGGSSFRTYNPDKWIVMSWAARLYSNDVCPICGRNIKSKFLEAHEVWEWDDNNHLQKLNDIIGICHECHQVKHYFRSYNEGGGERALHWLSQINGWTKDQAQQYVNVCAVWKNKHANSIYTLDLSNYDYVYKAMYDFIERKDPNWFIKHKELLKTITISDTK